MEVSFDGVFGTAMRYGAIAVGLESDRFRPKTDTKKPSSRWAFRLLD
ncbi:MAG TPA: hypothetical protein VGD21_07625 [Lysobacter sp.]